MSDLGLIPSCFCRWRQTMHSHKEHAAAAQSVRWRFWSYVGVQRLPDGNLLELRLCPDCGSTLARPTSVSEQVTLLSELSRLIGISLSNFGGAVT